MPFGTVTSVSKEESMGKPPRASLVVNIVILAYRNARDTMLPSE